MKLKLLLSIFALLAAVVPAYATKPYEKVIGEVNDKCVKLFGAGGFRGAESFGTGIIISPDGHILTAASPFLQGTQLTLHLPDGRKRKYKVKVIEPEFDAAILEIIDGKKDALGLNLDYFDIPAAAKAMNVQPGDWVLAFSNMYKVAIRDELMSVQRAMVTATGKLSARRGAFEVPFNGDVFYLDTITNNPGAAGGAVVTRKGELIGMIGKEFRNTQTETWVNYAIPLNTKAEFVFKEQKKNYTLAEWVDLQLKGEWPMGIIPRKDRDLKAPTVHTGLIFVPRVVERTPPYIEEVEPNSPAAKAGFKPDDLVIYFDGEPVYSTDVFRDLLKRYSPGDKVQIEIRRGDRLTAITIELAPVPKK